MSQEQSSEMRMRLLAMVVAARMDDEQMSALMRCMPLMIQGIKEGTLTTDVLSAVVERRSAPTPFNLVIDFDEDLSVPGGYRALPSPEQIQARKRGRVRYDPRNVILYYDDDQKGGRKIEGHALRTKLQGIPVYGDALLDFYMSNPRFVPPTYKGHRVYFFGTIRHLEGGELFVRFIEWRAEGWRDGFTSLDEDFGQDDAIAIYVS